MSPRTVERVDDWETVPFGGGYSGLRDLATQEFSGVVTAGPTRLFMIRGTVVGVLDGSIDDFEDSSGTATEAPHPALPLLAVMQERSDEVRAKYYTEDTPIADVDRTLADGSFTGYVELSENVLSGDYYQVYHQGRSMSVAYVGSSGRLITDDEAFEQANDEVGIYEVRPVAIDPIEIPGPADDAADTTATSGTDGGHSDTGTSGDGVAQESAADEGSATGPDSVDVPSATGTSNTAGEPDTAGEPEGDARAVDESRSRSQEPAAAAEPDESADDSRGVAGDGASASRDEASTSASTAAREDTSPETEQSRTESESRRSDDSETSTDSHPAANVSSSQESSSSTPGSSREDEPTTDDQPSQSRTQGGSSQPPQGTSRTEPTTSTAGADRANPDPSPSGTTQTVDPQPGTQDDRTGTSGPSSGGGATDLEVRSIPSLDPARTKVASNATTKQTSSSRTADTAQSSTSRPSQPTERSQQEQQPSVDRSSQNASEAGGQGSRRKSTTASASESGQADRSRSGPQADGTETTQQVSSSEQPELASELEAREQEIRDLRTDLERVEAERDELESERGDLEAERDRLQAELEEAQAEIEQLTQRLEDFAEESDTAGTQLSKSEAIDNTNLFVRYRSKGDATLETAHSGNADQSAVAENMRLEYHTQFDADDTAVGNEPFDDFLTGTIQYRFVDWLIGSLLYEVRDTGHADGMADLYNALPKIDRAELNGQVSVTYAEDGEEHRSQERFDVVVRDRMGNPLFVANINDSRDPATDAMMTDLIKRAERVGESGDTLAGAFLVTESFFEPEALETAEGATSSGLFSRDKRKSFVNLSRKDGYHLCLVEARNQEFHLAVPEL